MSNFSNNTFCRTSSCQINQFEHHPHSASDREAFSTQEYSEVYAILLGRESFGTKFVSFSFSFSFFKFPIVKSYSSSIPTIYLKPASDLPLWLFYSWKLVLFQETVILESKNMHYMCVCTDIVQANLWVLRERCL
uniref:Uncharacterized protein n=1 Tax=Myotis myotis TaxID=51298 RepID=A0A7J7UCQ5_MYOMY|nr:hypothetical protein mMyoMyo1_008714 [Myotis myotis]